MHIKRSLQDFLSVLIFSALGLHACQQSGNKSNPGQNRPAPQPATVIHSEAKSASTRKKDPAALLDDLKASMVSYLETAQPPYTITDINSCEKILKAYIAGIQTSRSKAAGMQLVENTVLELNALNSKTQQTLIETDQREMIAEIIILASSRRGYNHDNEDITEQWREW